MSNKRELQVSHLLTHVCGYSFLMMVTYSNVVNPNIGGTSKGECVATPDVLRI